MLVAIGIASTIDGKSGQGLLHDHRQQNPHVDGDAVTPMSEFDEEAGQWYMHHACGIPLCGSNVMLCVVSRELEPRICPALLSPSQPCTSFSLPPPPNLLHFALHHDVLEKHYPPQSCLPSELLRIYHLLAQPPAKLLGLGATCMQNPKQGSITPCKASIHACPGLSYVCISS